MNKRNILTIFLSVLFIALAILIKTNAINNFDAFFYNLITINMSDILTNIFKVITFFGSTIFIVILCVVLFIIFIILRRKNISFIIASCLIVSTIFNNVIKIIIRRPRPEVLKLVTETTYSFPSGHTMASVTMYGILLYLLIRSNVNKKIKCILGAFLMILPILVGISRIYLGAHFASDILGGMILSTILLLIETGIIVKRKWL